MSDKYDDIINLPHHQSATRPRMSMRDRAAQFSPFAALTGYGDAVKETARLTGERIELDDTEKEAISDRLQIIAEHISEHPEISVTYFLPDERKAGGEYVTVTGSVKKIDEYERVVVMADGYKLPIDEIADVEGPLFGDLAFL
ncbi:MAG: hypothetical protein VB092_08105 [Oscillospiraceae bacterium]|nr:hypothetical protein [Oscillospiraceae bacterium]